MYLVCGEALFDVFLDGETTGGSLQFEAHVGGSPFNVAIGIARLGSRAGLLAGISEDMLGQRLVATLQREAVSTDYLVRSGKRTTLSLVGVNEQGEPDYAFYGQGSADSNVRPDDLPAIGEEVVGLHFGSYSLVLRPVADAFSCLLGRAEDMFVSVDPNVRLNIEPDVGIWRERVFEYAARANLLKISAVDLAALYPGTSTETKVTEWLEQGVELVVVTDGEKKVSAWSGNGHAVQVHPRTVSVVDTVGAGDSFQSALLVKLAEDGNGNPRATLDALGVEELTALLSFAASAASVTCQRRGADLPRRHELQLNAVQDD